MSAAADKHGWDLNLPSDIVVRKEGAVNYASVNDRGAKFLFIAADNITKMKVSDEILKYGVTNCNSGVLSSRNNIKIQPLWTLVYSG